MKKLLLFSLFCVSLVFAKPLVVVSIPTQEYFVEKIAGDSLEILVMVSPSANHETYEPKPSQMSKLSNSTIYFAIGLPFEDVWLKRFVASSPNMKIVRTDTNITKLDMIESDEHSGHKHGVKDPHIWLDPLLIKQQALTIALSLSEIFPQNREFYMENLEKFNSELNKLHDELFEKLSKSENRDFLVFHPSLGYFANRFNLNQIAIEIEGKEPKAAELVELLKLAKEKNIKILFSEPQISSKSANLIAKEISAKIYIFDPLKKDVIKNLTDFTNTLLEGK